MANAFICDRCGKVYKTNNFRIAKPLFNPTATGFYFTDIEDNCISPHIDLCDECLNKLEKWLDNEE